MTSRSRWVAALTRLAMWSGHAREQCDRIALDQRESARRLRAIADELRAARGERPYLAALLALQSAERAEQAADLADQTVERVHSAVTLVWAALGIDLDE